MMMIKNGSGGRQRKGREGHDGRVLVWFLWRGGWLKMEGNLTMFLQPHLSDRRERFLKGKSMSARHFFFQLRQRTKIRTVRLP